jgi:hypothetical protein
MKGLNTMKSHSMITLLPIVFGLVTGIGWLLDEMHVLAATPQESFNVSSPSKSTSELINMEVCPDSYSGFKEDSPTLTCGCLPPAMKAGDVEGANPYTRSSKICRSALHAGILGVEGGKVVVTPEKAAVYPALTRNGVSSKSSWEGFGFRLAPGAGVAPVVASTPVTIDESGMSMEVCPDSYSGFKEDSPTLTCGCLPPAMKEGDVEGANPYTKSSKICRSALHAGILGAEGGKVVVTPEKVLLYPALIRNGVTSRWSPEILGFRLASVAGVAPVVASTPVTIDESGMHMEVCPDSYSGFREDSPMLTCGCLPPAMKAGEVEGTNPYTKFSKICRSALHAGILGMEGGKVVVTPEKATVYPALTRNGVASRSSGESFGFRLAAASAQTTLTQIENSTASLHSEKNPPLAVMPSIVPPTTKISTSGAKVANSDGSDSVNPTMPVASVPAESRTALVIGNLSYKDAPLRTPGDDARAIASTLQRLGFNVDTVVDAKRREMLNAIEKFGTALRTHHGVGLLFYAGHGIQIKGHNYLIPIDTDVSSEMSVVADTVDLDLLLGTMAESGTRINLVVLDACRNNPYERRIRGMGRGLAPISATETRGTFIAYSTEPGKTAADGDGNHSPYAQALLDVVEMPTLSVEAVFKQVRVKVMQLTNEAQIPWESSSLTGDFRFK